MAQERTFLGEAALRLQRMLGVTGNVSPAFPDASAIQAVVSVGDGTLPGYGGQALRRFLATIEGSQAVGFGTTVGFTATVDCIITSFCWSFTAASGPWRLKFFGPADALPWAINTPNGIWIDRANTLNESAPLLGGFDNTGIAVGGAKVFSYDTQAAQVGTLIVLPGDPFLLAKGASLILTGGANNVRVDVNVSGMSLTGN